MLNRLLILVFVLAIVYYALGTLTNLRSFAKIPHTDLVSIERQLSIKVAQVKQEPENETNKKLLVDSYTRLSKARAEIFIRSYHLDQVVAGLFIVSLLLLLGQHIQRRGSRVASTKDEVVRTLDVHEEHPREEYVDEWEFEKRTRDGFKTRDAAISWIKSDPLLTCTYCGSPMRSPYTGEREAIQLVTFYKQVPAGAKDLRVVLGTYWFAKAAAELRCIQCGRVEQR